MDKKTLQIYDAHSEFYVEGWLNQASPQEIHQLATTFFVEGTPTADIGCGSGRDVDWLNQNGFPCVGYDASTGLLKAAQDRFPDYDFRYALLPDLAEIPNHSFAQILCETVLMHLPRDEHVGALHNLLRITRPSGILALSWRMQESTPDLRDEKGRLYEPVDAQGLIRAAEAQGAVVLNSERYTSSSSGKVIEQLVLKKAR